MIILRSGSRVLGQARRPAGNHALGEQTIPGASCALATASPSPYRRCRKLHGVDVQFTGKGCDNSRPTGRTKFAEDAAFAATERASTEIIWRSELAPVPTANSRRLATAATVAVAPAVQ